MTATVLAFGGKGGSGKTTLCAMTLRQLVRMGKRPILVVDADPNATLALTLGEMVEDTIADIRDRMGKAALDITAIPKDRLMDQWLAELLTECVGFDILAMGRPEGPKCYCYVNALLRRYLKELRKNYPLILIDCEAGMEYLSRLAVDDVDALVLVTEATPIGVTTALRITELADSLPVRVDRRVLALNKLELSDEARTGLDTSRIPKLNGVVRVPFDPDLRRRAVHGEPIDDEAGKTAAPAVEELVRLCLERNLATL